MAQGVVYEFITRFNIQEIGFDMAIVSNVPLGGGLSSSASLEVAVSVFLEQLLNQAITPEDRALLCQAAEHNFAHMPCGIMDQFISSCGVRGNLLLIDCRANKGELVPLSDPSVSLVVCNSNKKHQLSGSEYPDRVRQCKEALAVLQKHFPEVKALRDATVEQVESVREEMDNTTYRRAIHVVSECQRCLDCKEALEKRDYDAVGRLLLQSHASLRDNFEVSTPELDLLVEIAMGQEGVFGARMTGGGFGGCIVCFVESGKAEKVMRALEKEYKERTGIECSAFVTSPSQGARVMTAYEKEEEGEAEGCGCEQKEGCCVCKCCKKAMKSPSFWMGALAVTGVVAAGAIMLMKRRANWSVCWNKEERRSEKRSW